MAALALLAGLSGNLKLTNRSFEREVWAQPSFVNFWMGARTHAGHAECQCPLCTM